MPTPMPKDTMLCGFEGKMDASQRVYFQSVFDFNVTVTDSVAGTGKTTLAVAAARAKNKPLYYLFAPVEERTMGFRTGGQAQKESAYLQPLYDALTEINQNPMQAIFAEDLSLRKQQKDAWVYAMSHTFRRGTNLKGGGTVIVDEVQNFTKTEIKKIITRLHDDMEIVLIGNLGQCDIDPKKSCLPRLLEFYADKPYSNIVKLTTNYRGMVSRDAEYL